MSFSLSRHGFFIFLAAAFFVFICYIIICADTGQTVVLAEHVRHLPFGDKAGHFILYGILAFLVNLAMQNKEVRLLGRAVLLGSLIVVVFAIAEEFTQIFLAKRSFVLIDICCDLLGIGLASYLARRIA